MTDKPSDGEDLTEDWLLEKTRCDGCDCTLKQIIECPVAQAKGRRMDREGL